MNSDTRLESALAWPEGTLGALREGFEKKHRRGPLLSGETFSTEAYTLASRYYMRGPIPISFQNTCSVTISENPGPEFSSLLNTHFVVCDERVSRVWHFERKIHHSLYKICEAKKTFDTVRSVLESSKAFPNMPWLIIGGGITCDLAAFAAHLAGVEFTLVPTTLLAMVDASIGGKTGVNFPPYGKNLVGAFAFPEQILIYTHWLQTLPEEEFYSGASECIKHAILGGLSLEEFADIFANYNLPELCKHLPSLLQVKTKIVQEDPFEKGKRALLNLGHTLAHALEAASDGQLSHGRAVALGLIFESRLALVMGYQKPSKHKHIAECLKKSKCLLDRKSLEPYFQRNFEDKLFYHMQFDKKTSSERIPFSLLGAKNWVVDVPVFIVLDIWREFCKLEDFS